MTEHTRWFFRMTAWGRDQIHDKSAGLAFWRRYKRTIGRVRSARIEFQTAMKWGKR